MEQDILQFQQLDTISLEEIGKINLMNRVSIKYLIPRNLIPEIIKDLKILEINGSKVGFYSNIYLDTENDDFFNDSIDKSKNPRYKVRYRTYSRTNETFLEIKKKENKIVIKDRILAGDKEKEKLFVEENTKTLFLSLEPKIKISYNRLSLTDKNLTERLTIDYDINFKNLMTGVEASIDNTVLELKQHEDNNSELKNKLETILNLKPVKFSKYVFGRLLTGENL